MSVIQTQQAHSQPPAQLCIAKQLKPISISRSRREVSTATNIVFPCNSSILHRSKYSARAFPAGHSWLPTSVRSSRSRSGGLRRPENESEMICGGRCGCEAIKSSGIVRSEGAGGEGIDMGGRERERRGGIIPLENELCT
jgi:hypothetical protein